MNYSVNDRLSKLIFIELKDLGVLKEINLNLYKVLRGKEILFPVDLKMVADVKNPKRSDLTMDKFFIGMLLCIGGNEEFIYNDYYEDIILNFDNSQEFYKGYIYSLIQNDELFEAYIMLKGLSRIYFNEEYKEKLISVLFALKDKNDFLKHECKSQIDDAIKNYKNFNKAYMYKSMMERDEGNYILALHSIDNYIKEDKNFNKDEIEIYRKQLLSYRDYEDGKEKIYSSPKEAMEKLVTLIEIFKDDALLYYYIAIACRRLSMFEQAIYYLECSRKIDTDIVEVVNEIGLNYASLNMYENAVNYFETVFKVTNAIEVCTNIIMCYFKLNEVDKMNNYFKIAKSINKDDEILRELETFILGIR